MSYTQGQIEEVASRLRQMQPATNPKSTMREAVELLLPELLAMRARGFQLDEIAQALGNNGLTISASTLKAYMRRAQAAKATPKGRKRGQARSVKAQRVDTPRPQLTETRGNHQGRFTARADSDEI